MPVSFSHRLRDVLGEFLGLAQLVSNANVEVGDGVTVVPTGVLTLGMTLEKLWLWLWQWLWLLIAIIDVNKKRKEKASSHQFHLLLY